MKKRIILSVVSLLATGACMADKYYDVGGFKTFATTLLPGQSDIIQILNMGQNTKYQCQVEGSKIQVLHTNLVLASEDKENGRFAFDIANNHHQMIGIELTQNTKNHPIDIKITCNITNGGQDARAPEMAPHKIDHKAQVTAIEAFVAANNNVPADLDETAESAIDPRIGALKDIQARAAEETRWLTAHFVAGEEPAKSLIANLELVSKVSEDAIRILQHDVRPRHELLTKVKADATAATSAFDALEHDSTQPNPDHAALIQNAVVTLKTIEEAKAGFKKENKLSEAQIDALYENVIQKLEAFKVEMDQAKVSAEAERQEADKARLEKEAIGRFLGNDGVYPVTMEGLQETAVDLEQGIHDSDVDAILGAIASVDYYMTDADTQAAFATKGVEVQKAEFEDRCTEIKAQAQAALEKLEADKLAASLDDSLQQYFGLRKKDLANAKSEAVQAQLLRFFADELNRQSIDRAKVVQHLREIEALYNNKLVPLQSALVNIDAWEKEFDENKRRGFDKISGYVEILQTAIAQ